VETTRKIQPEKDRQNRTDRTGHDRQNRTNRNVKAEQDKKKCKGRTGQTEMYRKNWTCRI
jgi:hypothetical protein